MTISRSPPNNLIWLLYELENDVAFDNIKWYTDERKLSLHIELKRVTRTSYRFIFVNRTSKNCWNVMYLARRYTFKNYEETLQFIKNIIYLELRL